MMLRRSFASRACKFAVPSVVVIAYAAALGGAVIGAQEPMVRSLNDGVFSEAQSARGKELFEKRCTACHEPGRFQGAFFLETWVGKPLFDLWDVMRTTMPEDNPGSLAPQEYADITTYFMSLNGFPATGDELKGTEEAMRAVRIEPPAASAAPAAAGVARR